MQLTAEDGIALRLRTYLGKDKSVRFGTWKTLFFCPWNLAICPVSILLDYIDHTWFRDLPEIEITNDRGLQPQVAAPLFVGAPGKYQSIRIKPATIGSRIKDLLVRNNLISAEREGAHILRGSGASHALAFGFPVALIQKITGHKFVETLLHRYVHDIVPPVPASSVYSHVHISLCLQFAAKIIGEGGN